MIRANASNWAIAVIALTLSATLTWLCYAAAGATLGMFLGGLGVVTILTPPLVLAASSLRRGCMTPWAAKPRTLSRYAGRGQGEGLHVGPAAPDVEAGSATAGPTRPSPQPSPGVPGEGEETRRLECQVPLRRGGVVLGAIVVGVAAVWLPYLGEAPVPVTVGEWLACVLVVAAYAAALAGLALLIARISPPGFAAGLVVTVASLWLTWPIWLAPHLQGESSKGLVAVLVAPHPLFAMDGVLQRSMGVPWAQSPLAYRWTNLGDDVPYQLPGTVLWCALLHLLIAGACFGLIVLMDWRQREEPLAAPAA